MDDSWITEDVEWKWIAIYLISGDLDVGVTCQVIRLLYAFLGSNCTTYLYSTWCWYGCHLCGDIIVACLYVAVVHCQSIHIHFTCSPKVVWNHCFYSSLQLALPSRLDSSDDCPSSSMPSCSCVAYESCILCWFEPMCSSRVSDDTTLKARSFYYMKHCQ